MKEYELTVLIHPDLGGGYRKPSPRFATYVKNAGGEIVNEDN